MHICGAIISKVHECVLRNTDIIWKSRQHIKSLQWDLLEEQLPRLRLWQQSIEFKCKPFFSVSISNIYSNMSYPMLNTYLLTYLKSTSYICNQQKDFYQQENYKWYYIKFLLVQEFKYCSVSLHVCSEGLYSKLVHLPSSY